MLLASTCVVFLLLLVAIVTALSLTNLHDRAIRDAERELRNIAYVLAEEIDRAFQTVELLETTVIQRLEPLGISSPGEYERSMSGHDIHLQLRQEIAGLAHVGALALVSADGKLINYSRDWPIPVIDVSDRDYFRRLKAEPHLRFFISVPARNRALGPGPLGQVWMIFLARKMVGPAGEFLGLVIAAIDTRYFDSLFKKVSLGSDGSVSLFRGDGVLLAIEPNEEPAIGQTFPRPHLQTSSRSGDGVIRRTGAVDLKERLIANANVPNYPLSIRVTNSVDAILAGWWTDARNLFGLATLLVLVICAIGIAVARNLHKQNSELAQREASFRLLFEGNPLPMWVHDKDTLQVLAVNDAATKHYGYTREQFLAMTVLDTRPAEDREEARRVAVSERG